MAAPYRACASRIDGCALSRLRFAAAFLPLTGPPRLNTLYHLLDRDVFKFALPDNPSATANRSPHPWIRRTEQCNRWTTEIGRQVRDAGIVADISTAAANVVEDFRKAQIFKHTNASPFGRGRAPKARGRGFQVFVRLLPRPLT